MGRRKSHRQPIHLDDYIRGGVPYVGIACDASCVGGNGSKARDGYFHGRVEWQCVDLGSGEKVFASEVQQQSTINIGEFLAIVRSLMILQERGDQNSPVWSDSKLTIGWVVGRITSTNLPRNTATAPALDALEEGLRWLKENDPVNPILWWNKHKFGDQPADYGRKGAAPVAVRQEVERCSACTPVNCTFPLCGVSEVHGRAQAIVDTFSGPDGSGTHLTTCTKVTCEWPRCYC